MDSDLGRLVELPKPEMCTCEGDDWFACVEGTVYGPCSSDNCSGVCERHYECDCPLHDLLDPGVPHDGIMIVWSSEIDGEIGT